MKCPFIINSKNEYIEVREGVFLLSETTETYAECCESECPYYNYSGGCDRVDEG